MKAALLLSPENIKISEIADPQLGPDQVMIRPSCVGLCGTDISIYQGHRSVYYPFVLGHEIIGSIAAVGSAVTKFCAGQRVLVEPNYPCGSCRLCRAGRGAICAQKGSMGVNLPGCLSEYAVAPAEFVWRLPDSIVDEDAATIEPLAVSMHALIQSGARSGDTVAVLGCGVVGMLLIHAAAAGGVRVIAHDRFADKLRMAEALGAMPVTELDDPAGLWERETVTTVFECAGASATVELALKAAPRGAQVILLGLASSPASFLPMRLVREGINIETSMIYDHPADFAHTINEVAGGALRPACVVTHTFPFESIQTAIRLASTGEAGKIHIRMF
jgi:L-iditol 2-dehydrogenase